MNIGGGCIVLPVCELGSLTIHQTILVKPFQKADCHSEAKGLSHVTKHASNDDCDSDSVAKSGLKAEEQFPPSRCVLNYLGRLKQNNCSNHILRRNHCFCVKFDRML